jgi:hypothetical protein
MQRNILILFEGFSNFFLGLTVSSWGAQVKPLLCRVCKDDTQGGEGEEG